MCKRTIIKRKFFKYRFVPFDGYSKLAAMKAERDGNHEFGYQLARLVELKKSMDDIKDGHNILKIKKQI